MSVCYSISFQIISNAAFPPEGGPGPYGELYLVAHSLVSVAPPVHTHMTPATAHLVSGYLARLGQGATIDPGFTLLYEEEEERELFRFVCAHLLDP